MSGDLAMLGRVLGGLIVVLVTIALVARVARRARGDNAGSGLRIVERIGLSREANLAVVEFSDRRLLLGVTSQGVTMLADADGSPSAEIRSSEVVLEGTEVSEGSEVFAVPSSRREARQSRTTKGAVAGAVRASLRRQLGLKSKADDGRPRRRGSSPGVTRDPALVPHTVSAPENIDYEEFRETEDEASELAASFGTWPVEPEPVAIEPAPVDALLVDVRDTLDPIDSFDSADSVDSWNSGVSAEAPRRSGRRAAGPPRDAAPQTRAENRASLRDAPVEDDRDENTSLPENLNLDEYPDLASALRAAGRTAAGPKAQPVPQPQSWFEPQPGAQFDPRPIPAPRRPRGPRSTYVPDSPAALLEASEPPVGSQAQRSPQPRTAPQAQSDTQFDAQAQPRPPARSQAQPNPAAQRRPETSGRLRPQLRPEARLPARSYAERPAAQPDTLPERTARQVAAFQAEAYPDAVSTADRTGTGKRARTATTAQGRHPAQPPTAPRAQSVLPERPHQPRRPQPAPQLAPQTRAQAQGRTPEQPPAQPSGRRSQQQHPQVNGSVLSPRTWRQGVDALRDLTVRRS
jgi:flagellar biogenesis protein FliO